MLEFLVLARNFKRQHDNRNFVRFRYFQAFELCRSNIPTTRRQPIVDTGDLVRAAAFKLVAFEQDFHFGWKAFVERVQGAFGNANPPRLRNRVHAAGKGVRKAMVQGAVSDANLGRPSFCLR